MVLSREGSMEKKELKDNGLRKKLMFLVVIFWIIFCVLFAATPFSY